MEEPKSLKQRMKGGYHSDSDTDSDDEHTHGEKGGSKSSGFIQRMMWETKHKHKGAYKKPTGPLAKDSKMNAPAVFELPKVHKPSEFLKSHFPEVKKGRKSRSEADEFIKKYRSEGMTSRQISKKLKEAHGITMNQSTIFKKFKSLEGSGDCDLEGGITIHQVRDNEPLMRRLIAQYQTSKAEGDSGPLGPFPDFNAYLRYYVKATNEHEAEMEENRLVEEMYKHNDRRISKDKCRAIIRAEAGGASTAEIVKILEGRGKMKGGVMLPSKGPMAPRLAKLQGIIDRHRQLKGGEDEC